VRIALGSLLLVFSLSYPYAAFAQGDAQAGKARWENLDDTRCGHCHGMKGEGAFGPDLAGRQLSFDQFKQAVRKPWGIMPTYPESQISDQVLANFYAYLSSLPKVTTPGPWRTPLPANAPYGQRLLVETVGCGQCHGDTMAIPRQDAGGINADFEWFKRLVYEHTKYLPEHRNMLGTPVGTLRMGNYSRTRLPEPILEEIWKYMRDDLKFRVPVTANMKAGSSGTYDLEIGNEGLVGKGMTAEDVTITLVMKPGTKVKGATGDGYKGVKSDPKGDMAVWQLARIAPKNEQKFTITLESGGISSGNVKWAKPTVGNGTADQIVITVPRPAGQ
jgi:mono/diheme cytochrome c family protein